MNKVAIAFLTKDRVELSKRTIEPLLQPDLYDLWSIDGSVTREGEAFAIKNEGEFHHARLNVRGGADPAAASALTEMLKHDYDYVGLVENDVLLHPDWFGPTFALFERGRSEGLEVGAASSRCYSDRILCQRDGYALCHNLGWGMQILTREAAQLTLKHMRTSWTTENRRTFARLSGIDIGSYWAFRTNEHWLTPDWQNDAVLASRGLASLALVPTPCEMVGQIPSLADQGLTLATRPVDDRRNDKAFDQFARTTAAIRAGELSINTMPARFRGDDGTEIIFSHQLDGLPNAEWTGDWRLKWSPGLGGFAARGFTGSSFSSTISGTCHFMVMGGEKGGQIAVEDLKSGYVVRPQMLPEASNQVTQVVAPANVSSRMVRLTVLSGSCIFYGLTCQEPQPVSSAADGFDHSKLWSAA